MIDNEKAEAKSKEYGDYLQKAILPLYVKDHDRNQFDYIATLTLVTYRNNYVLLTAKHALENIKDLRKSLYFLLADGRFNPILSNPLSNVEFIPDVDLAIIHLFEFYDGKLYFDLNINNFDESLINSKCFHWIGYPSSRSKGTISEKKSSKAIVDRFIEYNSDSIKMKTLRYFHLRSKLKEINSEKIVGLYDQNNVSNHNGTKRKGPKLNGMSGGAMYFPLHDRYILFGDKNNYNAYFIGIGIEHHKNTNEIIGIHRNLIIKKLDEYLEKQNFTVKLGSTL